MRGLRERLAAGDVLVADGGMGTWLMARGLAAGACPEALALAHTPLRLPPLPEWATPLVAIVAAQLFCYHVTRAKGFDTEAPRGLHKVTLTR